MTQNEELLLFKISRLEKKIRNIELSAKMIPTYCMDIGKIKFLTKYYCIYRSDVLMKLTFCLPGGGSTAITLNGAEYSFDSSVNCVSLPMKKGSNRIDISCNSTDGQILIEIG